MLDNKNLDNDHDIPFNDDVNFVSNVPLKYPLIQHTTSQQTSKFVTVTMDGSIRMVIWQPEMYDNDFHDQITPMTTVKIKKKYYTFWHHIDPYNIEIYNCLAFVFSSSGPLFCSFLYLF